jgi:hypothetical protein
MKLDALFLVGATVGLSACAAAPARVPEVAVATAAFPVMVEGASYQAIITPGASGQALTGAGAQAVAGRTIRVAPLAYDQGKRAKDVAQRACDQARGRFQPQAVGRFSGNEWVFEGGCA